MIYILHQHHNLPIIISIIIFACGAVFPKKILPLVLFSTHQNLVCGAFDFSVFFSLPICGYWKWFEFKYSVITTTLLFKTTIKQVSNNKSFVRSNLVRYKSKNRESHSEVCMCDMSTQQWPGTQIALFERTHQNTWLDDETTPVDRKWANSCVLNRLLLGGTSGTKKSPKKTGNAPPTRYSCYIFKNRASRIFNNPFIY